MPAPIKVELVPHSSDWAPAADREIVRLSNALQSNLIAIHHIGSTSIPGIHAKPILDLMPVVYSLAQLDSAKPLVEALGYQWWGEYGIAGRRYCNLDDRATGKRLVQLHCYQIENSQIERHLAFRDYLRSHPDIAREYDAEKQRCRNLHPDNSHAYTDAKSAWIESRLPLALTHFRKTSPKSTI